MMMLDAGVGGEGGEGRAARSGGTRGHAGGRAASREISFELGDSERFWGEILVGCHSRLKWRARFNGWQLIGVRDFLE